MENENPSYYAIIPADVRYDNRLRANEKLMYGEITCLSNKLGYCYSTNSYFAELYDVTPQAVSKWISNLEECGYIKTEYIRKGKEIVERRIFLVSTKNCEVSTKVDEGINKSLRTYKQKIKENTTREITTSDNTTRDSDKPKSDFQIVVETYFQNFKNLYEQKRVNTEKPYISMKVAGSMINRLLSEIGKEKILMALDRAILDNWIVEQGYSITTILSANQLNKLLNGKSTTSQNGGYVNNRRPASDSVGCDVDF